MAKFLGVDASVVEDIEYGRLIPSSMELQRLCRLYELELHSVVSAS